MSTFMFKNIHHYVNALLDKHQFDNYLLLGTVCNL